MHDQAKVLKLIPLPIDHVIFCMILNQPDTFPTHSEFLFELCMSASLICYFNFAVMSSLSYI